MLRTAAADKSEVAAGRAIGIVEGVTTAGGLPSADSFPIGNELAGMEFAFRARLAAARARASSRRPSSMMLLRLRLLVSWLETS